MLGILRACVSPELVSVHRTEPVPVITWCLCEGVASFAHSAYSQRPEERGYAWLLVSWDPQHLKNYSTSWFTHRMLHVRFFPLSVKWTRITFLERLISCFLLAAPTRAFSPTLVPPQAAHTWHASIVLKSSQGGKKGGGGYWSRFTKKKSSVSRFTANKKRHFTFHKESEIFSRTIYTYRFYIQIVATVNDRSGIAESVVKWVVSGWGVRGKECSPGQNVKFESLKWL